MPPRITVIRLVPAPEWAATIGPDEPRVLVLFSGPDAEIAGRILARDLARGFDAHLVISTAPQPCIACGHVEAAHRCTASEAQA